MFYKFIDTTMQVLSGYSNSSLPGRDYNIRIAYIVHHKTRNFLTYAYISRKHYPGYFTYCLYEI